MSRKTDIPAWRSVLIHEYPQAVDLSGKDLISLFDRTKDDVSKLVGAMVSRSEMRSEELPAEFVTSLTGEVGDEIHEWPQATLGPQFRHLVLLFRDSRLIHMTWKFQTGAPPRSSKPWWKFW